MKMVKGLYITFFIIYTAAFIILLLYADKTQLPAAAAIATILSLILVPSLYFLDIRRTKQDEQTRISKNLYGELKDTRDTLAWRENNEQPISVAVLKTDKDNFIVTNKLLNHDVYDSLINSGKINFLRYELQQRVQNIFRFIKQHNQYIQIITSITHQNIDEKRKMELSLPYYTIMIEYEIDLLNDIDTILIKLKKEFPRVDQSESSSSEAR